MLKLQTTEDTTSLSVSIDNQPIDNLLTKEWLLTNGRGSYASSTIVGCNTRAYHGLLIGSLRPPVNRIMALANCLEMIILKGKVCNLSTFEFNNKFAPEGFIFLKQFRRDIGAHFDYELDPHSTETVIPAKATIRLTKSVYFLRDIDTVAIEYDFTSLHDPLEFVTRPFIGLRDFHTLQKSYAQLCSSQIGDNILVRHDTLDSCELRLNCPSARFENDQQWWFNFVYRVDRERGQNFTEDLWTPGFFKCRIDSPRKIVLWATLSPSTARYKPRSASSENYDIKTVRDDLSRHQEMIIDKIKTRGKNNNNQLSIIDHQFRTLCLAADQFIVKFKTENNYRTTIFAGYPWFADWGRDAFIALPGLLLSTGRFDEAKSVLTTFAAAADEGMIPNRFDDNNGTAYFNSVDASLWFINAAFQYLQVSGDSKTFVQKLMPTIRWIIDSYNNGTRFGIHADDDGLITAGNNQTQLTWMDAKYDGIAFTPRYGKAVEVNALWYNSLCLLTQFFSSNVAHDMYSKKEDSQYAIPNTQYEQMANKVRASFCELFWNESKGYLNDYILPDGSADDSLRPNQIFAVSLGYSPLSLEQQKIVVDVVQSQLLTPSGLRTLNSLAPDYKGKYEGSQRERDEAYHQGTVWPYLIGSFVESYLKVNRFSKESKRQAAEFIQPLMHHLTQEGCLGSISEIFDGDPPHTPRGCFAQAWSVGELLRVYWLINS